MLSLYQRADQQVCPQMPWQILAAIGTVETDNDQSTLPGVHSGANSAGAEGPMQFEPATFAAYDSPVPSGGIDPPDIYDPIDAVFAAARMLCANGGASGDIQDAVYAYNHSSEYVTQVWDLAVTYGMAADGSPQSGITTVGSLSPAPGTTAAGNVDTIIAFALSQLGVPYVWGGTTPGVGLDCSGLVQLSYRAAGISLPRTSEEQATYGITVPVTSLLPGDLLFFNDGTPLGHVAIYLGNGFMIQAPYTGTVVSISPFAPASVEVARRIIVNS
jgi:cell wall-associated NlpC family hydrolase